MTPVAYYKVFLNWITEIHYQNFILVCVIFDIHERAFYRENYA